MIRPLGLSRSAALGLLLAGVAASHAADDNRPAVPAAGTNRPPVVRGSTGRILPDPALLDGSTQPAEKKNEMGMLGNFELPGDENPKSGNVGGPQMELPGPSGGKPSSSQSTPAQSGGAGAQSQSTQQGGGGAQGSQNQGGQGEGGDRSASGAQQAGGPQGGGPQGGAAGGAPVQGGGDPGAQAQGVQVAQLGGEASGQNGGVPGGAGQKPPQVAIGDKAMRIEPTPGGAGVVGAPGQQVSEHTQQYEKGTGSGGKGPSAPSSGNRIEKGRVVPAGL